MKHLFAILLLAISLISSASAYSSGNVVKQSISMSASGGDITQSASNAAAVYGNNNYVEQSITQRASGNNITQSAANAAAVVGNGNYVGQGVSQTASGSNIVQSGANAVAAVGDYNTIGQGIAQRANGDGISQTAVNKLVVGGNNNFVGQEITQRARGEEIYQTGWNEAQVYGNGNTLEQGVFMSTTTYTPPTAAAVDPSQTMGNTAYIMGGYNQVNQELSGYIMTGTSNSPVTQAGSNYIQTYDESQNNFDQSIKFKTRVGPTAPVSQSAQNEVRIGHW